MSWVWSCWEEQLIEDVEKYIINLMHQKRAMNSSASAESPANEVTPQQQPHMLGLCLYGLPDIGILPSHNSGAQTVEQEFEAYTTANLSAKGTDILGFWMVSETLFPTLDGIAMDYLLIQASAVLCWATLQKDMEYEVLDKGGETNNLLTFSSSGITGDVCDALLRAIAEEECDDIDDAPTTYDL
ncbi:hypothetical protein BDR03DRAFT_1013414 [Suillus americanus]|nr:hypothetical protein BDR03DRAFT_1013414 [Suillus americanus]